ncbi:MAG: nucleoside recognition protein [Lachnospiraceae bacterium]|nr:nucleoside recognition protein [Lachnospiraceae bacterium]
MLNYIWAFMILVGILTAAFTGNLETVSNSILDSARDAIDLLIVMAGVISMWNGFLAIAEDSGLTRQLTKRMQPLMRFFFPGIPDEHPANSYICANFIANFLGLGWACTPTGIEAMKSLKALELERGHSGTIASDEMCTFLILNISSLQLIPINMIAYRTQYGSPAPLSVVGPALLATSVTTLAAVILCRLMVAINNKA